MSIIGCDLDGVVADFNTAYKRVIEARYPEIKVPDYDRASFPSTWHWERELGLTKEQENEVWEKDILTKGDFWLNLPPYPWSEDTLVRLGHSNIPTYFITSRSGKVCKPQSEIWIKRTSEWELANPTVCVVTSHKLKVDVINGLSVTHYIDDRLDTMKLLAGNTKAKLYLFDQPWNREGDNIGSRVKRISDMNEFLSEVGV